MVLLLSGWAALACADEDRLAIMSWLSGCWDDQSAAVDAEECWSEPAGGLMIGFGRVISISGSVGFEYLRVVERETGLVFVAQPGGGPAAEFPAQVVQPDFARFSNPDHDYPRVIEYRRDGDRLTASIGEGETIARSETVRHFRFVLRDD